MNIENIRSSLNNTQAIKEQAYDRSSILDCLEQKIKALQEAQEKVIALEAQLKMAKESINLQQAEFSFQRSELEAEIQSLKSHEQQLRIALTRQSNQISANCSVDIQLEKEKTQAYEQKYKKWKKKAHDLRSKKKNLKTSLKKYDSEHTKLIDENIELQHKIAEQKQILDEERQASYSLSSETENFSRKLQKSENIINDLTEKNRYLSGQIQRITSDNQFLSDLVPTLKKELRSLKKQYREEIESSQIRFKEISNEKNAAETKLRQIKTELKKREMEIENISQEQIDINSSNSEITSKISILDEENQKYKLKNQSLQTKVEKLQETVDQYKTIQPSLLNCEAEMTALCDLIGIEPESVQKPWENLQRSIKEMVAMRNSYQAVKDQNSILQKRVLRLQSDIKNELDTKSNPKSPEKDEYYEHITNSMNQTKQENNELRSQIDFYKRKSIISQNIIKTHNNLVNQIVELHSAIFDSDSQSLRPVILCIIFAHRFTKIKSFIKSSNEHAQSLHVFQPRIQVGAEGKLADIREKFASLSQDLVSAKSQISDFSTKSKEFSENKESTEFELRNAKDQLTLTTKKLDYLRNRMYELQEDLSVLITPEIYQDTCNKLSELEKQNEEFKKIIRGHDKEIHKHEELEKSLQDQIEKIKIDKKQYHANVKEIRAQLEEKERDFEALKSVLREKTKEILSLERVVSRHNTQKQTDKVCINALASENLGILQNIDPESSPTKKNPEFEQSIKLVAMKNSGSGISSIINPLFLQ